jgi:hypothetical protein
MKLIYPDLCHHPNATKASAILNMYKMQIELGIESMDDSGKFKYTFKEVIYSENLPLQKIAFYNWSLLMNLKDSKALNFQKYLPTNITLDDTSRKCILDKRAIPLTDLTLEQKHVNWIVSRVIEFTAWITELGYSLNSITPDTIFVVPETHGVIFTSFYHMVKLNNSVTTISGKYRTWYHPNLFINKIALPVNDVNMIKRLACYLLGDKSGNGTKLKMDSTINQPYINFILTDNHNNAIDFYHAYRSMLDKNFKKEFHILNI